MNAAGVLLFSASLWGLSWMPLKWFSAQGLSGPVVSLVSYGAVALCALALVWRERAAWRAQWRPLLAIAVVGGWANTSFVNALMVGDVVRVMFLFYLSPVWSVLGGWLFLKEHIPPTRWAAVVAAIVGLWLVLGGPGGVELSLSLSDGLALFAGLAYAGNNLIARAAQGVSLRSKTIAIFIGCGVISLLITTAFGQRVPALSASTWLAMLTYGFVWLLLATATWQFGVTHLESSRAGVILLAELVVAVLTALWFGGEALTPMGWAGGTLIAAAALVEALDNRTTDPRPQTAPTGG